MYMVFNVGCIECGVSSKIVGLFADKVKAEVTAAMCEKKHYWREHGQNSYEIFELPEPEVIDPEYLAEPRLQPTPEMRKAAMKVLLENLKSLNKEE